MRKFQVRIGTPGKMVLFKNRQVRTPVVLKNVNERELDLILMKIRIDAIDDYDINEISNDKYQDISNTVGEEIIVDNYSDESIKEPKFILDKLLIDEYVENVE